MRRTAPPYIRKFYIDLSSALKARFDRAVSSGILRTDLAREHLATLVNEYSPSNYATVSRILTGRQGPSLHEFIVMTVMCGGSISDAIDDIKDVYLDSELAKHVDEKHESVPQRLR